MPITPKERTRRLGIINRALSWLEDNPQQHITTSLCVDGRNGDTDPRSESETACYCALGRIVHEAFPSNFDLMLHAGKDYEIVDSQNMPSGVFYLWAEKWLDEIVGGDGERGAIAGELISTNDINLSIERAPRIHEPTDTFNLMEFIRPSNAKTIAALRSFVTDMTGAEA